MTTKNKSSNHRRCILYILTLCLFQNAYAQTNYGKLNTWYFSLTNIKFNEHFSAGIEIHERQEALFKDQGTFIVRPSLTFTPVKELDLSIGYSYVNSAPSELYNLPIVKIENNIWEQMIFKFEIGEVKSQNRLRQEHRFISNVNGMNMVDGYNYANRFRFAFTAQRVLAKFEEKNVFAMVSDELWVNQNSIYLPTSFGRNWLMVGLGFDWAGKQNVQLRYMHQFDARGATGYISSSIIQLVYIQNFKF